MNKVSGVINIVIGLFILLFGVTGLGDYFGGNQRDLEKYEQLTNEGIKTIGILDSVYSEVSFKSSTVYSMDYTFKVDDKFYEGNFSFPTPDSIQSPFIEVTYLESDPEINAVNIEEEYREAQDSLNSKNDLWLGLGAIIVALVMLLRGLGRMRQK